MFLIKQTLAFLLAASVMGASAGAVSSPLQNILNQSKSTGRGVTFYVNGQAFPGVVTAIKDNFVLARSTAQGEIVIRLDRLDAVAGFVGLPPAK